MELHCNSIVFPMPKATTRSDGESEQFSITLPMEAIEMIEQGLIPFGLYGRKRASVCSALILDALKRPEVQGHIHEGRSKPR